MARSADENSATASLTRQTRPNQLTKMNKITIALAAASSWLAIQSSCAATVPAGTTLVVRTTETISSNEPVGKTFGTQLERDVVVGGRILLRAGTRVTGRVDSSRRRHSTPVILNVTQLASYGRLIPIKTVEGFHADGSRFKTRRGVAVGSGGFFQLPAGTRMQFHLAQPVDLGGSHSGGH